MKQRNLVILLVLISIVGSLSLFSQSAGDYRTAQSGNWNVTSTWQRCKITILAGHTVTVTVCPARIVILPAAESGTNVDAPHEPLANRCQVDVTFQFPDCAVR